MGNKVKNTTWTVTYDLGGAHQLVLLVPGQFMAEEFEGLSAQQTVESVDYIEAENSEPMALGQTKRSVKFTAYTSHGTPAAARDYCFAADLAVEVAGTATLTIAIAGGATYTLSPAAFRSWNFKPRRTGLHETEDSYELECGALALGAAAGPDVVGLAAAAINLPGTSGLLDAGGDEAASLEAVATWNNQGTGGNVVQATAGKQALALIDAGLFLPGIAGNYASIPDSVNVDFGTSFTLRIDAVLPSYRPAAQVCLAAKWVGAGNQRSWRVLLNVDGTITLEWSTDGTAGAVQSATSTVGLPLGAYEPLALWVQKDGNIAVNFHLSEGYDATARVRLGAAIAGPVVTAPFNSNSAVETGSQDGGTAGLLSGYVQRVMWWKNSALFDPGFATMYVLFRNLEFMVGLELVPLAYDAAGVWQAGVTVAVNKAGLNPARLMDGGVPRFDGADDFMAPATPVKLNDKAGATLIFYGRLNRVTGTQNLIWCATNNAANPRAALRMNGATIELHVRRLDGEATKVISYASGLAQFSRVMIAAVIDYVTGSGTIYVDGSPVAGDVLTSAGRTAATDSAATVLMAGNAGASPAAADASYLYVAEEARSFAEISQYYASIVATGGRA